MKNQDNAFYPRTKLWWLVLAVGVLMVIGGFCYWLWPAEGYMVASMLMGWLLIAAGLVQVVVSAGENRPSGWGWWLVGGVLDMFIGFMMVRSLFLAMSVFPYFLAFFFVYWGVEQFISAASSRRRGWWLPLVNGILLCIIGFLFVESAVTSFSTTEFMTSFLVSLAFIYWGFTLSTVGYEMKPPKE